MISIEILNKMNENKRAHIFTKVDSNGNVITVTNTMAEPASEGEIQYMISNSWVPDSYKEFLSICNGARLFEYEGIDGLQLLSVREVLKYTQYAKNTFEEEWDESIIIFAKIIGEDNYLGFQMRDNDRRQSVVLDCYFEERPEEWRIIASSFDEFFSKYLLTNGSKFWIE